MYTISFVFGSSRNMSSFTRFVVTFAAIAPIVLGSAPFDATADKLDSVSIRKRSIDHPYTTSPTERDPQSRLGFISYGTDVTGYQTSTNVQPLKIELGGVFVGTLIGLGIVLLAPKVSELFSHHPNTQYQGSFARRDDHNIISSLTGMMSKIDESLRDNHIDSTSCLERAACNYAESGPGRHQMESFFSANSSNPLVNFAFDGSKLKNALEKGFNGENCSTAYPQCSFTKNSLVTGIRSLMSMNSL